MDELDRDPMVLRWTRHHGLRIPYAKWWGGPGRYEPDFLVELVGETKELREVKGEHLFRDANTGRKLRAGDEFCRARGMSFRVVTKSQVDPDAWAPGTSVEVRESPPSTRPDFAEDLQPKQSSGCLTILVAGIAALLLLAIAMIVFL